MAAWFTVVKAIWPHIGTIIAAATPVFTQRQSTDASNRNPLWQQQIDELQRAAMQNTEHLKALAEQVQVAVTALEQAARANEAKLRRAYAIAGFAAALSLAALAVALYLLFTG